MCYEISTTIDNSECAIYLSCYLAVAKYFNRSTDKRIKYKNYCYCLKGVKVNASKSVRTFIEHEKNFAEKRNLVLKKNRT